MTSKTFVSGTVLDSAWLNDVNNATYAGSSVFLQQGTGAIPTTTQAALRQSVFAEHFGFSTTATAAANATYITAAIASGAKLLEIKTPGNYSLDNTSPIILNVDDMDFRLAAGVNILPTVNTKTVFQITASNVTFEGGIITGDGTVNITGSTVGRPISFIEVYGGAAPTSQQNVKIKKVRMVNPNNAGILFYKSVGGTALENKISSNYTGVWVQGVWGICAYSSAYLFYRDNQIDGLVEGITAGADPGYSFNDFAGTTDFNTRVVSILGNKITNFRDHGIYFSNQCLLTSVEHNVVTTDVVGSADAIKLTGSCNIVGNTTVSRRAAINGRSMYNSVIASNNFTTTITSTGVSANDSIIYLEGYSGLAQNVDNITITGNLLKATGKIGSGIYVYGAQQVAGFGTTVGAQNLVTNLLISNNVFSGGIGGDPLDGFPSGIKIFNDLNSVAASSLYGKNISITDNNMQLDPACSFGILLSGIGTANFDGVNVHYNTIAGTNICAILIGAKNSLVTNNTIRPNVASIWMKESDQTNTPCGNNYFGKALGESSKLTNLCILGTELSDYLPVKRFYNGNMIADLSLDPTNLYSNLILFPTASRNITIPSTTSKIPLGYIIQIHNLASAGGSNLVFSLSAGGATVTILPNTHKSFMAISGNTFVEIW